ncbi:unnamed protein product, partial [Closterium sp. NIES-53]
GVGSGVIVESVDKFGRGGADEDANDSRIGLLPLAVLGNRILVLLGCHNIGEIGQLLGEGGLFSLAMIEKKVLEVKSTHFTTQEVLVNPVAPCLEVGASAVGFKAERGDRVGESGQGEGHGEEPLSTCLDEHELARFVSPPHIASFYSTPPHPHLAQASPGVPHAHAYSLFCSPMLTRTPCSAPPISPTPSPITRASLPGRQLAASFGPRYYATVFKAKRLSGTGAQQMLLDTHGIKTILLELPALGGLAATAAYSKYVTREMGRSEALLKVVLAPQENLVDTYRTLLPDGSTADFLRTLDLKVRTLDLKVRPLDLKVRTLDLNVHPLDLKVRPLDLNVRPLDLKVRTLDLKVHPLDLKVRPLDLKVRTLDLKVHPLDLKVRPLDLNVRPLDLKVRTLDLKVRTLDLKVRTLDLKVRTLDLKVRPLDLKVHPLDLKVRPLDLKVHTLDLKVHPLDLKVRPLDLNVRPLDLKGVKKPEQQPLLDALTAKLRAAAPTQALPSKSPTSSATPSTSTASHPPPATAAATPPAATATAAAAAAAGMLTSAASREAMIARAAALGRGAMAQSAAAAAAVSQNTALKRIFALADSSTASASKKDMSFRSLFNA